MLFLGIDLGTSSIKLVVMDEKGEIKASAGGEYGLSFPKPGWSEQNPSDWVAQMEASIKALGEKVNLKEIAGISFGGQMHGLVILDENDANVVLSARNIPTVKTSLTNTINVYDILNANTLVVTKDAVKTIEEVYA